MHAESPAVSLTRLRLRKADESDLPFIRESARRWRLDDAALDQDEFLIAADGDGRTLAFGRILDHGSFQEVATVCVVPEVRGGGLGRLLVEALIAGCRSHDVWVVSAELAWFAELGFRPAKPPADLQKKLRACADRCGPGVRALRLHRYDPFNGR